MAGKTAEPTDQEMAEIAGAFRPKPKHLIMALLANLALGAAFLGLPYLQGRQLARASLQAFSSFAACLLDGKPEGYGGLGMPPGEQTRFAGLVLGAANNWPSRCDPQLQTVAPAEAIFLWPSVKQAGEDTRAAVDLVTRELRTLDEARQGELGRIPNRPLLALAKLRAALTLLAKASGTDGGLDLEAISFPSAPDVVEPTRLPLNAAGDAVLHWWGNTDGIEALALDTRGLSWLRLEGGKLDRLRLKRSSLMRAVVREDDYTHLVWSMPPAGCEQAEDHCVKRAAGVAILASGAEKMPAPTWLGGHPAGRPDRVLRVLGNHVHMVALDSADGRVEVRRFDLPTPLPPEKSRPLAANWKGRAAAPRPVDDCALMRGRDPDLLWVEAESDGRRTAYRRNAEGVEQRLGEVDGVDGWITSCAADAHRWVAFGSATESVVLAIDSAGVPQIPQRIPVGATGAFHPARPQRDRVRLVCDHAGANLLLHDKRGPLRLVNCPDDDPCETPRIVASGVSRFDAVAVPGGPLVAYAGSGDRAMVRVVPGRKDPGDRPLPLHVAACWAPSGGFCDGPSLIIDGARVLLAAREHSDLLAVESNDQGRTWRPMGGLKVGTATSTNVSTPMDQHRLRKGLE